MFELGNDLFGNPFCEWNGPVKEEEVVEEQTDHKNQTFIDYETSQSKFNF